MNKTHQLNAPAPAVRDTFPIFPLKDRDISWPPHASALEVAGCSHQTSCVLIWNATCGLKVEKHHSQTSIIIMHIKYCVATLWEFFKTRITIINTKHFYRKTQFYKIKYWFGLNLFRLSFISLDIHRNLRCEDCLPYYLVFKTPPLWNFGAPYLWN